MHQYVERYAYIVLAALDNQSTPRYRGRKLIIYAGREDFRKILQYAHDSGQLESRERAWFFFGCELVEVSKQEWFEVAFQGRV